MISVSVISLSRLDNAFCTGIYFIGQTILEQNSLEAGSACLQHEAGMRENELVL